MTTKQARNAWLICLGIVAIICLLWGLFGCALPKTIQGNCVPRSFFNSMAWGIENRCPVYIADFAGHFQAVGEHEGELHFLRGEHWQVWPGDKEGDKPMIKLWNLRDAMDHYLKHNPWTLPSAHEMNQLNEKVKRLSGREGK